MADLYHYEGGITKVEPRYPDKNFRLEELYKLLDCTTVQVIQLRTKEIMIIDEEGKLRPDAKKKVNLRATRIYNANFGATDPDIIIGSALVCPKRNFR
jgi:hypothetical protein